MRNFSEYVWGRTEKEYIEACENAGLDPQEIYNEFLGKLWNRITGRGQPAQNPMQQQSIVRGSYLRRPRPDDQGKLIPSDKGATSFNRNVGYGNIIASLVDAGIPSLTQNAYSQFLQKYGKPDKNGKIKNFFDVFS